jgi:hypothetical protein
MFIVNIYVFIENNGSVFEYDKVREHFNLIGKQEYNKSNTKNKKAGSLWEYPL